MTALVAERPEAVIEGPTWRRAPSGEWHLPAYNRTLGWQILAWTAEALQFPDGTPWKFTPEQVRHLLWWYAIDDHGRFLYRRGVLRRMKGWGKDPYGAVVCAIEFVGPCRFDHWDADGNPVAVSNPVAWVQTVAVALEQTKNTMTLFASLFTPDTISRHGIDLGKEKIYAENGRRRLEAVTSSPRAMEGNRPTFVLENETQHWLDNNDGHAMAAVIARNLAKSPGGTARSLQLTNAHEPGEDSIAERSYEAWNKIKEGTSRARGLMYDALEAPAGTVLADPASLRYGLRKARGDSRWINVRRLMDEIYDPETEPSTSRRYYLNQIVAAEDAWLTPQEWELAARREYVVPKGAMVTLGFDGSRSDDHTTLVACEVETAHLFTPLTAAGEPTIWNPAAYDGDLPRAEIDAAVKKAFDDYDVVGFYSDYSPFESYVDVWEEELSADLCCASELKHPIRWDFRTRQRQITQASESFHAAILDHGVTHEGLPRSTQYALNARRRINSFGVTFGKEHRMSSRKVDWLASAMLARLCRQDYIALPENKKRKNTKSVYEERGMRRL